ncbi:hydrogenase/urease nickel incorporation protein HypA [bacterium BMS3Bbin06]|nr:hydrogenase/urease nickel incorporation protein HypA [bacterium BMS3Bbin06]HDY71643.1 hydrogenase maturation nickel metallochaperone HypA [Nitrospirota bacterium]
MHEFSVVQSLFDTIEAYASDNNAGEVTKVVLKYGLISGIEPCLLKTAFDTFKEGTIAERAELQLIPDPLSLKCKSCDTCFEVDRIVFKCTNCGSLNVEVRNGGELILERLEMECPDDQA